MDQENLEGSAAPEDLRKKTQADLLQDTLMSQNVALQKLVEQSISVQKESNKLRRSANRITLLKYLGVGLVSIIMVTSAVKSMGGSSPSTKSYTGASYVNVVELEGAIGAGEPINAENLVPILEKAYSDINAKGVILKINSPGGSPVQSSIIHDRILALKEKYHKKTVVVGEDIVASGGYFIAVAADKITVNRSTLIGSIGVIHSSFGFSGLMEKVGVDRRVMTAGESKSKLDPFMPLKDSDKVFMQDVLTKTHSHFKDVVIAGRKDKLDLSNTHLFDGTVWTGGDSVKVGIADSTGDLWTVLETEFGSAKPNVIKGPDNLFQNLFKQVGVSMAEKLTDKLISSQSNIELK